MTPVEPLTCLWLTRLPINLWSVVQFGVTRLFAMTESCSGAIESVKYLIVTNETGHKGLLTGSHWLMLVTQQAPRWSAPTTGHRVSRKEDHEGHDRMARARRVVHNDAGIRRFPAQRRTVGRLDLARSRRHRAGPRALVGQLPRTLRPGVLMSVHEFIGRMAVAAIVTATIVAGLAMVAVGAWH